MRISFICFGLLLVYLTMRMPAPPHVSANPTFEWVITVIGLTNVLLGFFAPRLFRRALQQASARQPSSGPVAQWMAVNVVSLAFFDACMLFGFVLHAVGSEARFVEITIGAGLISLVVWKPKPVPGNEGASTLPG